MEKVTVDMILDTLQTWVEEKRPIDSHTWLDACMKLTILQGEEQGKLFILQQQHSKIKYEKVELDKWSVAKAKLYVESLDSYVMEKILEAKIERITELVRISKIQARMSDDQLKQN